MSYRGLPARLTWGDAYDKHLDLGYPLDSVAAWPEPRQGSEFAQASSGIEDAWITGEDEYLQGLVRWIRPAHALTGELRRHSGWNGADGWTAALKWLRRKKKGRWYPDFRNMLVSPRMNADADANGVVNDWLNASFITGGGSATLTFDAAEAAQKIELSGNLDAGCHGSVRQDVFGVMPGERLTLSFEIKTSSRNNWFPQLLVEYYNAGSVYIGGEVLNPAGTDGAYVRGAMTFTTPASTAWVRGYYLSRVNTTGATSGQAWVRLAMLERAPAASVSFTDQPGYHEVYLVEPMSGPPDDENDLTKRLQLKLRSALAVPQPFGY